MTKVILDLDETTLDRVASVARARQTSIEDLLQQHARDLVALAPVEIHNPGHRAIMAVLDEPPEEGRAALHDRRRGRAGTYADNRRRLLALIDATTGDLGSDAWSRTRSYEP